MEIESKEIEMIETSKDDNKKEDNLS